MLRSYKVQCDSIIVGSRLYESLKICLLYFIRKSCLFYAISAPLARTRRHSSLDLQYTYFSSVFEQRRDCRPINWRRVKSPMCKPNIYTPYMRQTGHDLLRLGISSPHTDLPIYIYINQPYTDAATNVSIELR